MVEIRNSTVLDDQNKYLKPEYEKYISAINYLLSGKAHLKLTNTDEQMLFLILKVDPNLTIFNTYANINLQLNNEIIRQRKMDAFYSTIRETFGFYDPNLLTIEKAYVNNYLCKNSLLPKLNKECKKEFIAKHANISFENITDEQLDNVKKCIEYWEISARDSKDINTLIYNIEAGKFNIHTPEEEILLFIMIFDPELELLKIYEEESKKDKIILRASIEIGIYDESLITLEKKYKSRFLPDKKISDWSI